MLMRTLLLIQGKLPLRTFLSLLAATLQMATYPVRTYVRTGLCSLGVHTAHCRGRRDHSPKVGWWLS